MMASMLEDVTRECQKALRPPARTARGRAAAVNQARLTLIRARRRLVVARTAVGMARGRVQAAQAVVDRARRALARARADARTRPDHGTGQGQPAAGRAAPVLTRERSTR